MLFDECSFKIMYCVLNVYQTFTNLAAAISDDGAATTGGGGALSRVTFDTDVGVVLSETSSWNVNK